MKHLTILTLGLAMFGFGLTSGCTVSHESSDKPSLLGGENHESKTEVKDLNGGTIMKSDSKTHD